MDIDKIKRNKKLRLYIAVCLGIFILMTAMMHLYGWSALKIIRYLTLSAGLAVIAAIDWEQKIIPNKILLVMTCVRIVLFAAEWAAFPEEGFIALKSSLIGAVISGGLFGICYLLSRGGMGAGDVKLMTMEGFYLGSASVMPAMIIIALCAAAGNIAGLIKKKLTMKTEVPFGPYVFVGTILAALLGV